MTRYAKFADFSQRTAIAARGEAMSAPWTKGNYTVLSVCLSRATDTQHCFHDNLLMEPYGRPYRFSLSRDHRGRPGSRLLVRSLLVPEFHFACRLFMTADVVPPLIPYRVLREQCSRVFSSCVPSRIGLRHGNGLPGASLHRDTQKESGYARY